ncbi:MAG: ankyrin repeat domain-containing protein [Planctomycetes bacterium]|nr:ankyrin repeat domain-containing protein [Planctomycetota bacterium]
MPATPQGEAPRELPERPNLRHLKLQAEDLVKAGAAATVADAQFTLARQYGFPSWPKLKAHVELLGETGELKAAIDANDLERVKALMTHNPELHRAPLGYNKNGPLTWVAECRVPRVPPSAVRLEMARWMIAHGSDIHQGGDGPLMRAALSDDRIPMLELLVAHGADVNAVWDGHYPIICAPCECLAPQTLQWLLDHGANPRAVAKKYGSPLAILISTYSRDAAQKHACLEVFAQSGFPLPDTPALAFHRGRIDLLEEHLKRDPALLSRQFTDAEIFPPELGIKPGDGLHVTPVAGGTLLHLAIEYDELEMASWLLERGADANAQAARDGAGFGGHTPLYHCVVSLGRRDDAKARLLLDRGADPNARATFRKQLRHMGHPDKEKMHEFHNVTPIGYARQFQEPKWVSADAVNLIAQRGGTE